MVRDAAKDGNGQAKVERKAQARSAALTGSWRPQSVNVESRTAEVVFSSGADVERIDPWTGSTYTERLVISDKAISLARLRRGAPVLDSHDRSSVRNQIGVVQDAWVSAGRGHARIQFSKRAQDLLDDVADGVIRNVSIGYTQDAVRKQKRDGKPELYEVTRWTPFEVSLVTVPADAAAQVRHANTHAEEGIMEQKTRGAPQQAALTEAQTQERERCQYVTRAANALGQRELGDQLIADGVTIEEASRRLVDAAAAVPSNDEEIDHHIHPDDGTRRRDFAEVAGNALLHRERIADTEDPAALALTSRSMVELARQCCELDGVGLSQGASRAEIATRALNSSATLTDVIAHTAGRSLTLGYEAEPRVFAEIFREASAQNFRPLERVKLSDVPTLPIVAEGADYTEAQFSDTKETYSLASYGTIVALTRQLLINDDVDSISRVPQMLGAAAAARENDTFWGVLNTNAAMVDTRDIFNVTDGNLVVSALDAAALEAARLHMQSQQTENGVSMGLQPAWLVVGPDLLTAAEKLVRPPVDYSTSTLASTLSTALANQLQLRVEPRVATGEWFVFSDYRRFDTCEYSYLAGQRGVYMERDVRFESGAIRLKATVDFGSAAIDRRGLYQVTAT